uniref:Uncharacterized protein n=1 Tax=Anthurium amnicola TaxID=1678845 RepID=A0A1D1XEB9_9ARAE
MGTEKLRIGYRASDLLKQIREGSDRLNWVFKRVWAVFFLAQQDPGGLRLLVQAWPLAARSAAVSAPVPVRGADSDGCRGTQQAPGSGRWLEVPVLLLLLSIGEERGSRMGAATAIWLSACVGAGAGLVAGVQRPARWGGCRRRQLGPEAAQVDCRKRPRWTVGLLWGPSCVFRQQRGQTGTLRNQLEASLLPLGLFFLCSLILNKRSGSCSCCGDRSLDSFSRQGRLFRLLLMVISAVREATAAYLGDCR